jgi:alpha-L-rhamnosidase
MFQISDLRCEYTVNPIGIDTLQPRFSWQLEHDERAQAQTAYQILVASSLERLASDSGDLWDSGKTVSSPLPLIEYAGTSLSSRQRAYWKVRAWDNQGRVSAYSEPAWFEVGLLQPDDWRAEWVGFPSGWNGKALYFREAFQVEKPVARARAYVCGLGWHELSVNGQKVGDRVLEPAQTDFSKRVLYTTYDIEETLRLGMNLIGVTVGNGWYGTPKLLAQLEIQYQDGSTQQVITGKWNAGGNWWRVADGPIIENSIYDGEVYDARLERPGWDTPEGFAQVIPGRDNWAGAMVTEPPGGKLVSAMLEPIKVVETRRAVELREPKPSVYVYDVGQNLAGWARIRAQAVRGTTVTLRFAESLYEDGTVNQENLRAARARDVYIFKGEGVETWEPRFTYHGFRYVQLEGIEPTLDTLEIRVVRSSVDVRGQFECDHPLINQLHRAIYWTEVSNLHGVPTDCPQRDERMGWLNDMAARSEEIIQNFDMARLLPKWVNDIADTQNAGGAVADTAPFRWGSRPGDPVVVCYLLIPALLYAHYGDRRVLEEHYEGMRRWVDFLTSRAEGHIVSYGWIGDWAPPIAEGLAGSVGSSAVAKNTPGPLVWTAYYAYAASLFARIARILGREADVRAYQALFEHISEAFNERFWDEEKGGYGTNNQACNTLAIYMGLTPPGGRRELALTNLVRDIQEHDCHLTTGNLTTKYIFEVLTDGGYGDLAFALATQTSYPSWGYMLANGATTIWERWEQATGGGMNSHNHPMYGSIGAWFYRALAGIRVRSDWPGCGEVEIRPLMPTSLNRASGSLKTVRGLIASAWERVGDGYRLRIKLPVGSGALVTLPLPDERFVISEGGTQLWPSDGEDGSHPGVVSRRMIAVGLHLSVESGTYEFHVTRSSA